MNGSMNMDHFTLTTLTAMVNELPYKPGTVSRMGLFEEQGVNTLTVQIDHYEGVLSLVPVSERGGPAQGGRDGTRKVIPFTIPHLKQDRTVRADEVQNVRAFGTENQLEAIETLLRQRQTDMRNNLEYTLESHRLAAIMGEYFDAGGNRISLHDQFGVKKQTHAMGLDKDATDVRGRLAALVDKIDEALGGLARDGIVALCSPTFYDALVAHPQVQKYYLNWQAAAELRGADSLTEFSFLGVRFIRYRGTTDVGIPKDAAFAFPTGVNGLFLTRFAPADYAETVNTIGLPYYSKLWPLEMNRGWTLEVQSSPLNICTRPQSVVKLTLK